MAGTTLKDVLLNLVESADTVNEFRTKTNAIINLLNTTSMEKLPPVYVSDTPPTETEQWMWYRTTDQTLMTKQSDGWYPFHEVYAYEMKFYKKSISQDKTIPTGFNAMSVSPVVEQGVTVRVSEGSTWRIQ